MKPAPPAPRIVLPSRDRSLLMVVLPRSESESPQEIERFSDRPQPQRYPDLRVGPVAEIEHPDIDQDIDALVMVGHLGAGVEEPRLLDVVVGLELEAEREAGQSQPAESADLVAVIERDERGIDPGDPGVPAREPA